MRFLSKSLILLFFIALLSGILLVNPISAQSTSKPSVPEFSANYVDHSYYVPLTYTNYTNPYTGQQETETNGGYTVENKTIDVTIKNQPFTSTNLDGNNIELFYEIRWKGHFENWTDYNFTNINYNSNGNNYLEQNNNNLYNLNYAIRATNSEYTVVSYSPSFIGNIPPGYEFPNGGQIDFQVKAQVGYTFLYYGGHIQAIGTDYHFVTESDWSNAQTVTISNATLILSNPLPSTVSASVSTSTPTVPELSWLAIILPLVLMLAVALVLRHQKFKSRNFDLA